MGVLIVGGGGSLWGVLIGRPDLWDINKVSVSAYLTGCSHST